MPEINVYYGERLAGTLAVDGGGALSFVYVPSYLQQKGKQPVSRSLPLRGAAYSHAQCSAFFEGLLPDISRRYRSLYGAHVAEHDVFGILDACGGDTAGALSFGDDVLQEDSRYDILDEAGLNAAAAFLEYPQDAGLPDSVRCLMPGCRDKISVRLYKGDIALPVGAGASNYIMKTCPPDMPDTVYNEASCMRLAERCGLHVAPVIPAAAGNGDCLLVKRYDRKMREDDGTVTRLHQESFSQALGMTSDRRRQIDGGASLPDCFGLLRAVSTAPVIDLLKLYDIAIFNMIIGNHDAHAGKFCLLYDAEGRVRLAPCFDIYSHAYDAPGRQMSAMDIGGEYDASRVSPDHASGLAESAGLSGRMATRRAFELAQKIHAAAQQLPFDHPVTVAVYGLVRDRAHNFLSRF